MDTVIKGPVTIAQGRSVHGYSKPAAPNFFFMTYKQLRQYWSTIKDDSDMTNRDHKRMLEERIEKEPRIKRTKEEREERKLEKEQIKLDKKSGPGRGPDAGKKRGPYKLKDEPIFKTPEDKINYLMKDHIIITTK